MRIRLKGQHFKIPIKRLPTRINAPSGADVSDAFRLYLRPLLGSGMPDAFRLRTHPVAKVLKRG